MCTEGASYSTPSFLDHHDHGDNHHQHDLHRQPVCWEDAPCPALRSIACTGRPDPAGPVSTWTIKNIQHKMFVL